MSHPSSGRRILHVSAHYPPNFVSGGTLVPQRLARAQRDRGHDARVYAGFLDEQRPPLQAWDESDETGLPVRWIVTTPWTAWHDRTNYCNPPVEFDFQEYLHGFRPDIVHVHSLQTLGAGLLSTAADSGARVVLTMHDFWWLCARQFLVDRDLVPCCLVVDAGVCQCQVDRAYLAERHEYLSGQLTRADAILAPSASAAAVLAANGIPEARLRVDENGLPESAQQRTHPHREARAGAPNAVRFLFTGGPDPMKGAQVLFAAASKLADTPGWAVDAYGFADGDDAVPAELPAQVRIRGQYAPDELDEVMLQHDVLIVPSLMRESHSIVTREALIRGLAVVCTDTLGPEEAVAHGVNGLVVPAGDADGLADAIATLVGDRALVQRLRAAGTVTPVRSLGQQLDGLDQLYQQLAQRPAPSLPGGSARRWVPDSVLFVVGIDGAPLRYRAWLPAEALALHGVAASVVHYRDPEAARLAETADAVVFYRVPATVQVLEMIAAIRLRPEPVPVLFDVDDLIFDPDLRSEIPAMKLLDEADAELWIEGVRRYRTTMEACDFFVGSTEELCRYATAVTGMPSARFPNGAGLLLSQASDVALRRARRPGPLRIGYLSGTTTHDHDWLEVEDAVVETMRRRTDIELWLGGHINPSSRIGAVADRVRYLPMMPWHELPDVLRDLDVNLAPLEPVGRFNEAKSAIKWLEAALVATPTIASPTQPFREAIVPGVNGLLAATHEDWLGGLELLLTDPLARRRLASRARRDALLRYSAHRQAELYLDVLEQARAVRVERGAHQPSPDWAPIAHDEPFTPTRLAPYVFSTPVSGALIAPAAMRSRVKRYARATVEVYRQDGWAEVARRATLVGRRAANTAAGRVRQAAGDRRNVPGR